MPGILQEKFQVDNPQNPNDDGNAGWVSDKSARRPHAVGLRLPRPPGTNIEAQRDSLQHDMPLVMSGESDVSKDTNPESFSKGFKRLPMRATDDEYTKAHQDAFYDEMNVGGDIGFAERNNMLDRL